MKKLIYLLLIPILCSCSNSDEKFGLWMKENNGKAFSSEHMKYLISEYGEPIDTINALDDKIPTPYGFSIYAFYGPEFIDLIDSKSYIDEYKERFNDIFDKHWFRDAYGNLQPRKEAEGSYEYDSDRLEDEFKGIYMAITGVKPTSQYNSDIQIPWTIREFITEYQRKVSEYNDEISFEQSKDSIIKFFHLDCSNCDIDLNSVVYRFKTITTSSKDYWPNTSNPKEIDVYRDVRITNELINFDEVRFFDMDGLFEDNWCVSEKSRNKLTKNTVDDWVFRENGKVVAAYKFFSDGSYSWSSDIGTLRGGWSINCNGQITRSGQGGSTLNYITLNEIEEDGIYYEKE